MSEMINDCKRCNGKGTITCRQCFGAGTVFSAMHIDGKKDCSACQGSGELRCPACLGSGIVSYTVLNANRDEHIPAENIKESNLDIFLSYSTLDSPEANKIYEAIIDAGGRVFMSEKDVNPGEDFAEIIRKAIRSSRELWLLVSPHSIKSDWVISEWGAAWALGKKIVPILHRCKPEDLPDRIRRLQCKDFYQYPDLVRNRFRKENSGSAS